MEGVAAIVTAVLAGGAFAGFMLSRAWEPVGSFPYRAGVAVGFIVAALYVTAVFKTLRRWGPPRTTAAALLAPIAIIVLSAAGGAALGTAVLTVVNGRFDGHGPSVHRAIVIDKARVGAGNRAYVRVTVPFWYDNGRSVELRMPAHDYDRIEPRGTQLVVTTRPGALGWEWIDGTPSVAPPAPPPASAASASMAANESAAAARAPTFAGEPQSARQYLERGLERLRDGQPAAAAGDFARARELDPGLQDAYEAHAQALQAARDYAGIIQVWSKLLEVHPDNAHAWHQRANARLATHDLAGALVDAEQACRLGEREICPLAERLRARADAMR